MTRRDHATARASGEDPRRRISRAKMIGFAPSRDGGRGLISAAYGEKSREPAGYYGYVAASYITGCGSDLRNLSQQDCSVLLVSRSARPGAQFAALERRTMPGGPDKVDHPQRSGHHDDIANVDAAGLVLATTSKVNPCYIPPAVLARHACAPAWTAAMSVPPVRRKPIPAMPAPSRAHSTARRFRGRRCMVWAGSGKHV